MKKSDLNKRLLSLVGISEITEDNPLKAGEVLLATKNQNVVFVEARPKNSDTMRICPHCGETLFEEPVKTEDSGNDIYSESKRAHLKRWLFPAVVFFLTVALVGFTLSDLKKSESKQAENAINIEAEKRTNS